MSRTFGRPRRLHGRRNGQALVEFAIVFPVFVALLGAIIQFGMIFWAQNTLTQVVRDTGRWAATQQAAPCDSVSGLANVGAQADLIAANASLWGHTTTEFGSPTKRSTDGDVQSFTTANAMAVAWVRTAGSATCPPSTNLDEWHVTIRINQTVPTFFPGMQFLPALGTCDPSGCHMTLSSTAQFRMEPKP
jgi:Flp pilus assembly protein TadG